MNPGFRGVRNMLAGILPKWLANRPGFQNWYKTLWTIALMGDALVETALEGLRAAWPGYGTPDALPLIGQTRGFSQGLVESNASFITRLINWLTTWMNAASDEVLLQQIWTYLGNAPQLRLYARSGWCTTLLADGVSSSRALAGATAWNWDGNSNPERSTWWSDMWLIVYPPLAAWVTYASFADDNWLLAWSGNGYGIGHACLPSQVDAILSLIQTWKGAHTRINAIVWTTDGTLFDPANLGISGNPDGWWGHWSKVVSGTQVAARNNALRYWVSPTI
jgi:hypothetical protein